MKRILLITVMLLTIFVSPAMADAPVRVMVDYEYIPQPGLMINGTVYVPLNAVSEAMGANAEWLSNAQTAFIVSDAEPTVEGDAGFKKVIADSLDLLHDQDSAGYSLVCDNIRKIGISDNSESTENAMAFRLKNTKEVYFTHAGMASNYFIPQWVASTLVHEAVHCTQVPALKSQAALNKLNEGKAYSYQLTTLVLLNAPQSLIDAWKDVSSRGTK